jgi:hypothetical protein
MQENRADSRPDGDSSFFGLRPVNSHEVHPEMQSAMTVSLSVHGPRCAQFLLFPPSGEEKERERQLIFRSQVKPA